MSETKWTPGPWIVQPDSVSKDCEMPDLIVGPTSGEQVAHVYVDNDCDKANANLIAAAPDLYKALEIAIETFNLVDIDLLPSSTNKEIEDTLRTLERVLLKARGEQPNKEGES